MEGERTQGRTRQAMASEASGGLVRWKEPFVVAAALGAALFLLGLLLDVTVWHFRAEAMTATVASGLPAEVGKMLHRAVSVLTAHPSRPLGIDSWTALALIAPFEVLYGVGVLLLSLLALFVLLSRAEGKTVPAIVAGFPSAFPPFLALILRIFIRSWAWFPLLLIIPGKFLFEGWGEFLIGLEMMGVLFVLSFAPPLALAPLLFVRGMGIQESLQASRARASGHRWSLAATLSMTAAVAAGAGVLSGYALDILIPWDIVGLLVGEFVRALLWVLFVLVYVEYGQSVLRDQAVALPMESLAEGEAAIRDDALPLR